MRVGSQSRVEWPLLFQHIPRDPLWSAVESWETAFKVDLLARRDLYLAVERVLVEATGLPLVERLSGGPALAKRVAYSALQQAHLRVLDLPARDVADETVTEGSEGSLEVLGIPHAGVGPGLRSEVVTRLQKAVTPWEEESDKARWKKAYTDLEAASAELHRIVTHLRLLRYLPGVCDVCGRFEV